MPKAAPLHPAPHRPLHEYLSRPGQSICATLAPLPKEEGEVEEEEEKQEEETHSPPAALVP